MNWLRYGVRTPTVLWKSMSRLTQALGQTGGGNMKRLNLASD
jgi:hypothetical protein